MMMFLGNLLHCRGEIGLSTNARILGMLASANGSSRHAIVTLTMSISSKGSRTLDGTLNPMLFAHSVGIDHEKVQELVHG